MRRTAITITRPASVHVRLTDARDTGAVTINDCHFDLRLGVPENITSALCDGTNVLTFIVTTQHFREKIMALAIDRPHWTGRFELLINTHLMSVFQGQGVALLGGSVHQVARVDLNIITRVVMPQPNDLVERLRRVPGMTDVAASRAAHAWPALTFQNGVAVHTWKNRFGVDYVCVQDQAGALVYGGYVGWVHAGGMRRALDRIRQEFLEALA